MHSLSSWTKSIPGELLSSSAHFRFDFVGRNIKQIFSNFNLSNFWEAYMAIGCCFRTNTFTVLETKKAQLYVTALFSLWPSTIIISGPRECSFRVYAHHPDLA